MRFSSFLARFAILFGMISCLIGFSAPSVWAAEVIRQFDVEATIHTDRTVEFQESITYDFGDDWKHGIFRVIPMKYKRDGLNYHLHLNVISVKMDGENVRWEQEERLGGIQLKIGDPDATIKGPHVFQITYQTDRALNDFSGHHELYWNVTGNEWEIPIEASTFRVRAPTGSSRVECYTGIVTSRERDCTPRVSGEVTEIQLTRPLERYEGFTVVVGYPLGTVHVLRWYDRVWQIIRDNALLFIPVLVFGLMFLVWWKKGREPRGRGTVIPHYEEPQGLPPAILAALTKQHVGLPAITATILDLGRRGYLKVIFSEEEKITSKKKETFILRKLRVSDDQLRPYEKDLFEGLFGGLEEMRLTEYRPDLWKVHQRVRNQILNTLKESGWMRSNPETARSGWILLAIFVAFVGFIAAGSSPAYLIVGIISGLIIALFGWQMPQMTKEGAILLEEIKGFKQFLSVTEKQRLAFSDAPQKTPEQFARFLPAAVALGVEDQWSAYFADMQMSPPDYVQTSSSAIWTASALTQSLHGFSSGLTNTMSPPESTSGGGGSGFSSGGGSGGGGGGGGGGSW